MSIASDSRVVDALQDPAHLQTLLRALGCSTHSEGAPWGAAHGCLTHCPMPDHPDRNPSCEVLGGKGMLCCYVCGGTVAIHGPASAREGTILPLDLVVEHGQASDRAEAAKWVEDLLGLETAQQQAERERDTRIIVRNPGLSVAQYLAIKHLSPETEQRFGLRNVRVWIGANRTRKGYSCEFTSGIYGAVMLPCDAPGSDPEYFAYRPRIRDLFGARWAAEVQVGTHDADGSPRSVVYENAAKLLGDADDAAADPDAPVGHIQRSYGYPQLAPAPEGSMLQRVLFVVEGESDVHALHDLGITSCIGIPGASSFRTSIPDLLDAIEKLEPGARAADWTIAVWAEPGDAGEQLPGKIASSMATYCTEHFLSQPRVAALAHSAVAAIPVSPLPGASAVHAKDPCELIGRLVPLHRGDQVAARAQAAQLLADAAFVTLGRSAGDLDPQAPAASVAPAQAMLAPVTSLTLDEDPWIDMDSDGEIEVPPRGDCPPQLQHLGRRFTRTPDGWAEEAKDKNGDDKTVPVSTIFYVQQVQDIGDEDHVVLCAPRRHSLSLQSARVPRSELGDPRKIVATLGGIGCTVNLRMGGQAGLIAAALCERWLAGNEIVKLPAATGWTGRAGTGPFGGLDAEPLNTLGAMMYEANKLRRAAGEKVEGGTAAQARRWWDEGVMPLISEPQEPSAAMIAPLLAIGAAAAAPLIAPLSDVGVTVSPVLWIAGRGGGGKSITQRLCATMFAPSLPSVDGQVAFFASANISKAALGARVEACRDLPLILDDVTQLPPEPGSTSRGDDARLEAAAQLGMFIFNRKPIERATREGGSRLTRAFRSTAIFSAEINMSSETSKAAITPGHRRRISTIEAKPMSDRGLGEHYAEQVNRLAAQVGGAPGEVLIDQIRTMTAARQNRGLFDQARSRIAAMPQSSKVDRTQLETLAIDMMGFALTAQTSGGWTYEQGLDYICSMLGPYLEAGAGAGGATQSSDIAPSERIITAVEELLASQPQRWDYPHGDHAHQAVPSNGFMGKVLRSYGGDTHRRVILYRDAQLLLLGRYAVTQQMIQQAIEDGVIKLSHQYRNSERKLQRGMLLQLPYPTDDADDWRDPDAPRGPEHDADPFGLARTMFSRGEVHEAPREPGAPALQISDDAGPEEQDAPAGDAGVGEELSAMLIEKMGLTFDVADRSIPPDQLQAAMADMTLAHVRRTREEQGSAAAAQLVTDAVRHAMICAYETRAQVSRTVYDKEGTAMKGMRFIWGVGGGFYAVQNASEVTADPAQYAKLVERIKQDVANEIAALQEQYAKAAEADPEQTLGAPIVVADLPELDDPRMATITGLGWEVARQQWNDHWEATYAANHSPDPATARHYHELNVKHVRIHLMARLLHPEWFIVDEAQLQAPAA